MSRLLNAVVFAACASAAAFASAQQALCRRAGARHQGAFGAGSEAVSDRRRNGLREGRGIEQLSRAHACPQA